MAEIAYKIIKPVSAQLNNTPTDQQTKDNGRI